VTNRTKLKEGIYQATTQVKVLSSEMDIIVEVDAVVIAEDSTAQNDDMVRKGQLYRGQRPWHGIRWYVGERGRSIRFSEKEYIKTMRKARGLMDDLIEVGLIDSTRKMGKPFTGGSDQQKCDNFKERSIMVHRNQER
jgi:hypothetical protein